MSNIENNSLDGCFLISRSIFDSWIWSKPDWYLKLWIYFIGKANHSDKGTFKRGELFLKGGYRELQQVLAKKGGYGKKTYEKYEISKAISAMTSAGLVHTRKTTRGMYIIISNYNDYQTLANYEKQQEKQHIGNSSATLVQLTSSTINKNDNNEKNEKKLPKGSSQVVKKQPDLRITELIDYLKLKTELEALDGTIQQNRFAAANLFKKLEKLYPEHSALDLAKQLIDLALIDQYLGPGLTSIPKLYYKMQEIIQRSKTKQQRNNIIKI